MPTSDHLWTEEEAGRYLSVSPWTIRSWRQKGKIGYTSIGGVFRYIPEELKEFATNGRVAPLCPDCKKPTVTHSQILLPNQVVPGEPRYFSDIETQVS